MAVFGMLGVHTHHKLQCAGGCCPAQPNGQRAACRHASPTTPLQRSRLLPIFLPPAADCMQLAEEVTNRLVKPPDVNSDDPGIAVGGSVSVLYFNNLGGTVSALPAGTVHAPPPF